MEKIFIEIIKFFCQVYEADGMTSFIIVTAITINIGLNVILMYALFKLDKASRQKDEKYLNLYSESIVPLVETTKTMMAMMKIMWFVKNGEEFKEKNKEEEK